MSFCLVIPYTQSITTPVLCNCPYPLEPGNQSTSVKCNCVYWTYKSKSHPEFGLPEPQSISSSGTAGLINLSSPTLQVWCLVSTVGFLQHGHCWVFQIFWHIECSTLTVSSFRTWNSSAGILLSPLVLLVVMLPKAHMTSHSKMSCSRWVTTPSWLSG